MSSPRHDPPVHGFIVVDKPSGVTSFSIVSLVRRLSGVRRVGHAGTLDPLASGVLPVAVGQATRFIAYMDDAPKAYEARLRFGASTDTFDAEGSVTAVHDASGLTAERVEAVLPRFIGEIEQVPPAFSAIKLAGKPLYRYAREGQTVTPAARRVRIHGIELRELNGAEADIAVTCGKGTYIRSLAHDIGEALGVGAHLVALRRTASGGFTLDDARTVDELRRAEDVAAFEALLVAPDRALERRPVSIVSPSHADDVRAGRDLALAAGSAVDLCRAYSVSGDFLGVLRFRPDGRWHPEKVLSRA